MEAIEANNGVCDVTPVPLLMYNDGSSLQLAM